MKRASFRDAIEWIACNDDAGESNVHTVAESLTVALVSDLFDVPVYDVARKVLKLRCKMENDGQ